VNALAAGCYKKGFEDFAQGENTIKKGAKPALLIALERLVYM
jgi:hypothetical protein